VSASSLGRQRRLLGAGGRGLRRCERRGIAQMIDAFLQFIQSNRVYFEAANAVSSAINLVVWLVALTLLAVAIRRNRIDSVSVGPINIRMKEEAVSAAASAARAWPGQQIDVPRIRATVDKAFTPEVANNLTGKAVLWVDDHPENNKLVVRALRRFHLDVEQVTSTEAGLAAAQRRPFDLVISDMGRGDDMRAGYALLKSLRARGSQVPFFIFSSGDKPEFRKEAKELGAQLSTNNMLELIDYVISYLGNKP
jgi:CheY-like chemotaxis protein